MKKFTRTVNGKQVVMELKEDLSNNKVILTINSDFKIIENVTIEKTLDNEDDIKEITKLFKEYKKDIIAKIKKIKTSLDLLNIEDEKTSFIETDLSEKLNNLSFKKLFLYGATGSGKTKTALQYLKENCEDVFVIPLSSGMEDIDLMARYIPQSDGSLAIQESNLYKAFVEAQNRKIGILFDEINRAPAKVLNLILKILDDVEGKYIFRNYITSTNIEVNTNNLIIIATANLGGSYAGTFTMDEAFFDRFDHILHCDYDKKLENYLINNANINDKFKEKTKKLIDVIRSMYKDLLIPSPLSTRMLINFLKDLENTKDFKESMFNTFIYRIVDVDRFGYPEQSQIDEILKTMEV